MPHGKLTKKLSGIGENPYGWGKTARSAERARARALGLVASRRGRRLLDLENDSRLWGMVARHSRRFGWWWLHSVAVTCLGCSVFLFLYKRDLTLGDLAHKA